MSLKAVTERSINLLIKSAILLLIIFVYPVKKSYANERELVYANEDFPPWFIEENNHFIGIDVEILQELASRMELKLTIRKCPWKRCLTQMEKGQIDILTSLFKTPEREKYMQYLTPFYYQAHDTVFFVKRGKGRTLKQFNDLYQLSVGTVRGEKYFQRFDQDKKIDKQIVNEQAQLPKMLKSQRIDTFLGDETVLDYLVIKTGFESQFEKAVFRIEHPEEEGGYIALSKNSHFADRHPEFSKTLNEMIKDGTVQSIIDNFYSNLRQKYVKNTSQ